MAQRVRHALGVKRAAVCRLLVEAQAETPSGVETNSLYRVGFRRNLSSYLPGKRVLVPEIRIHWVGGDDRPVESLRLFGVRERQAASRHGRDVGEYACARLPVLNVAIGRRSRGRRVGLTGRIQADQAIGLMERQRADGLRYRRR